MVFYPEKKQLAILSVFLSISLADAFPICSHGCWLLTHSVSHYQAPVTPKWQIAVSEVCHLSVQRCVVSHVHWSRVGTRFMPSHGVFMAFFHTLHFFPPFRRGETDVVCQVLQRS